MGMQISSLSSGSVITVAPPPQEFTPGKRMTFPGEQKVETGQNEAALPGSAKPKAPDIKQTTSELERISVALNRRLKFEIDQESRQILVKVIDNETDKVIKVLPPEELQRLHSKIRETFGFLFDRMV